MNKPNPLQKAVEQISEMLEFIIDHKDQPMENKPLPPFIEQELERLEAGVKVLQEINQNALKKSGISDQEMQEILREAPNKLSSKERRIIEKAMKLKQNLLEVQKEVEMKARVMQRAQKKAGGAKSAPEARKKKFKRLGSKKDWKPI